MITVSSKRATLANIKIFTFKIFKKISSIKKRNRSLNTKKSTVGSDLGRLRLVFGTVWETKIAFSIAKRNISEKKNKQTNKNNNVFEQDWCPRATREQKKSQKADLGNQNGSQNRTQRAPKTKPK